MFCTDANEREDKAQEDPRGAELTHEGTASQMSESNSTQPAPTDGANGIAPEAKGADDAESDAAPPPPNATLLKVCEHDGVTMEALQARGSEAAAKEKIEVRATLAAPGERALATRDASLSLASSAGWLHASAPPVREQERDR